jgi:hypothetical protein
MPAIGHVDTATAGNASHTLTAVARFGGNDHVGAGDGHRLQCRYDSADGLDDCAGQQRGGGRTINVSASTPRCQRRRRRAILLDGAALRGRRYCRALESPGTTGIANSPHARGAALSDAATNQATSTAVMSRSQTAHRSSTPSFPRIYRQTTTIASPAFSTTSGGEPLQRLSLR